MTTQQMTEAQSQRLTELGANFPSGWDQRTAQQAIDYHEWRLRSRGPRPEDAWNRRGMIIAWTEADTDLGGYTGWVELWPNGTIYSLIDGDADHDWGRAVRWDDTPRRGYTRSGVRTV